MRVPWGKLGGNIRRLQRNKRLGKVRGIGIRVSLKANVLDNTLSWGIGFYFSWDITLFIPDASSFTMF